MKTHLLLSLCFVTGCVEPITLVVVPDAGSPDAPPPRLPHCEIPEGASWVELGSPLSAVGLLPPLSQPIAMADGVIATASLDRVYTNASGAFVALPSAGLPSGLRISALTHHDGTWWIGTDGAPGDTLFRFEPAGARWEGRGRPFEGGVLQLVSAGTVLVVHTQFDAFFSDDPRTSSYRVLPRAMDEFVSDVAATSRGIYVVLRGLTTRVVFAADGVDFVEVPSDAPLPGDDLAATDGLVIVSPLFGSGYARLDEGDAVPSFRFVPVAPGAPIPSYLGRDGTVVAQSNLNPYFGAGLDGPFFEAGDHRPAFNTPGASLLWYLASDATSFVLPTAVSGGTLVERSTDRGRSFSPAATARTPALALELASDGTTPMLRLRGELGEWKLFALREGDAWEEVRLPHRTFAGVTGLARSAGMGRFVSRTSEYGQELPHQSTDGGRTWQPLDFYFPAYDTNAGSALRVTSGFALDVEGRLLAGTVGGITSICCTGSKVGWDYRTGAGVWRYTDGWTALNAGIPIESGPDPLGGPPFRSDVEGIVASEVGVFARLRGRGVYRLVADRWSPDGRGLPLDLPLTLFTFVDDTGRPRVAAYAADALYVREVEDDGLWIPARFEATAVALAAQRDLLVASRSDGLFSSGDAGETWSPLSLPIEAGVAPHVAFTRDRLYLVGEDHRMRALPVTCTEGE